MAACTMPLCKRDICCQAVAPAYNSKFSACSGQEGISYLYTAPPAPLPASFCVKMEKDMPEAQLSWNTAPPA